MKIKKLSQKVIAMVIATITSLMFLVGCGGTDAKDAGGTENTEKAESGKLIPVTIYGITDPQEAAQLIIAKNKGYFEDEGLDVTNVLIESSSDLPAYIASGEAPVSAESQYTCTEVAAQGVKLKTLMTNSKTSNTQGLILAPGQTIKSAKDLEGKTLGIMNGAGFMLAIQNMCKEMDVDLSKINIVYLSPSEQVAALQNGSIDMMACWEPYMSQAIQSGGTLLFTGVKSYFPEKTGDVDWLNFYSTFQVTEDYYNENHDTCIKLVKAMTKATDYINENLDECSEIIAKELNNDKDAIHSIMVQNTYENIFDDTFAAAVNDMAEYMHEAGNIDNVPSFDSYCDPSILKEVKPENASYEAAK